jgi:predicted metal-dependent peptidase
MATKVTASTTMVPIPCTDEMTKARITARMVFNKVEPFLAQFSASREVIMSDSEKCYTDGKKIFIGWQFCKKLPRGVIFAYSHELWHIALNHLPRFQAMKAKPNEHALHNILTDLKINMIVKQALGMQSNEWSKYEAAEIVTPNTLEKTLDQLLEGDWKNAMQGTDINSPDLAFRALAPFCKKQPVTVIQLIEGTGELGDKMDPKAQKEIERAIEKSISAAKARGAKAGSAISELEDLWCDPKIPWKNILSNAIKSKLHGFRSWSKFNRRSLFG